MSHFRLDILGNGCCRFAFSEWHDRFSRLSYGALHRVLAAPCAGLAFYVRQTTILSESNYRLNRSVGCLLRDTHTLVASPCRAIAAPR